MDAAVETGRVITVKREKRFGFLEPRTRGPADAVDGDLDLFFHVNDVVDGFLPDVGSLVTFVRSIDRKGRGFTTKITAIANSNAN